MRTFATALAGAAIAGLALTGIAVPAAIAAPAAPASAEATAPSPITADRYVVSPGEELDITLEHGREAIGWVSSAAFVRNEPHPMGLDEGLAVFYNDTLGFAHAKATIADVPPGRYVVRARVGGGTPQPIEIQVR